MNQEQQQYDVVFESINDWLIPWPTSLTTMSATDSQAQTLKHMQAPEPPGQFGDKTLHQSRSEQ
jgi:hypothetical protein